ncbi:MAG: flagellar hook-length control protein FliK [Gaiellales bacterium]
MNAVVSAFPVASPTDASAANGPPGDPPDGFGDVGFGEVLGAELQRAERAPSQTGTRTATAEGANDESEVADEHLADDQPAPSAELPPAASAAGDEPRLERPVGHEQPHGEVAVDPELPPAANTVKGAVLPPAASTLPPAGATPAAASELLPPQAAGAAPVASTAEATPAVVGDLPAGQTAQPAAAMRRGKDDTIGGESLLGSHASVVTGDTKPAAGLAEQETAVAASDPRPGAAKPSPAVLGHRDEARLDAQAVAPQRVTDVSQQQAQPTQGTAMGSGSQGRPDGDAARDPGAGRQGNGQAPATAPVAGQSPAAPLDPAVASTKAEAPLRARARLGELADVANTVIRVAARDGKTTARITLRPVELGEVEIRLRYHAGGVTADVVAESRQAAQLLSNASGELRRSLESQGLTVHWLDVRAGSDERRAWERFDEPGSRRAAGLEPADDEETTTIEASSLPLAAGAVDVLA